MARLYGFPRDTARLLNKVAGSFKLRSLQDQSIGYGKPTGLIDKKPLVRFTLGGALTTSTASVSATIQDQFSTGVEGGTAITVHNLETAVAGVYAFNGASGDAGLALWDSGTNYRIINIEEAANFSKKLFCRFTLNSALSTSDATKAATITTQWGPGESHNTSITVTNIETASSGVYIFSGNSGDAGVALYSSSSTWYICQMECA